MAILGAQQGLDLVINLEIDTEHVLRRLAARRVCVDCGANYSVVDNPPRVAASATSAAARSSSATTTPRRPSAAGWSIYERETAPLIDWYERAGSWPTVDALGDPDEVTDRLVPHRSTDWRASSLIGA